MTTNGSLKIKSDFAVGSSNPSAPGPLSVLRLQPPSPVGDGDEDAEDDDNVQVGDNVECLLRKGLRRFSARKKPDCDESNSIHHPLSTATP